MFKNYMTSLEDNKNTRRHASPLPTYKRLHLSNKKKLKPSVMRGKKTKSLYNLVVRWMDLGIKRPVRLGWFDL